MNKLRCWIPIVVAIIVGWFVAMWPPLKFANLGGADFASRFSVIVFFSLLIERTVEIILSIWRSEPANRLEADCQRLVAALAPLTAPATTAVLGTPGAPVAPAGPAAPAAPVAPGTPPAPVAATAQSLTTAQNKLIAYKAETLQWAMPLGFTLGLLVAGLGVRALSQFVDPKELTGDQRWWFGIGDIVFTGALLAGGADPIHKLLDLYRKFVESSAAKAAGTK